ncbi:hypothetical protein MMC30_003190 [Trapelia coarctata]|nr:hypothetical protein [Trapelia coarctata]
MNGSSSSRTVLADQVKDSLSSSRLLGSFTSSSSYKRINSLISKTYKQASALYLQRRLLEAFQTLEPLISLPETAGELQNGEEHAASALTAGASRSNRVKVWNLYLSLLNAIIKLGPEEGKNTFGGREWRNLTAKARDGTVWDEVATVGYGGVEGNVDADVVSSLATLLLTHSASQALNQTHLETYLSAARYPSLDLSDRFENPSQQDPDPPRHAQTNGTDTPRDLRSRIKILELYALQVLPRNEEWQYAREFINMSKVLDEEQREAFIQELQILEDQKHSDADQEAAILWRQEEERECERKETQRKEAEEAKAEEDRAKGVAESRQHKRTDSEKDYGIDEPTITKSTKKQPGPSNLRSTRHPQANGRLSPSACASEKITQNTAYGGGVALITALQKIVLNMAQSISKNPMILFRTIFFLVALIVAFGRRDVRDRLNRITEKGWAKIKGTVGMGVKVSYL